MDPILKWAGGKRLLIPHIIKYINVTEMNEKKYKFYEPFVGGGAVAFYLELENTIINDSNEELINFYNVIKNEPDELISKLEEHQKNFSEKYYKRIRNQDRTKKYKKISNVEKAARFLFLNKTCYNGLYRVNLNGYFNVPIGKYENPDIVNKIKINKLHQMFNNKKFIIRNEDFLEAVKDANEGDVVYFDPPYDYEEKGFTSYSSTGFSRKNLTDLKTTCDDLINRGCKVIISNNDTEFVNNLFNSENYYIEHIEACRFINCDGTKRKKAKEVIIYGYKR